VLDSSSLENPHLQREFAFLHTLNPHCTFTDLPEQFLSRDLLLTNPPELNAFDVICLFNISEAIAHQLTDAFPHKVIIHSSGVTADLVCGSPSRPFPTDNTEPCPTEQAVVGALISQMIVDYLPPLGRPVAVRLTYNPATWASSVHALAD
jgi:hypothetical protein